MRRLAQAAAVRTMSSSLRGSTMMSAALPCSSLLSSGEYQKKSRDLRRTIPASVTTGMSPSSAIRPAIS
jgi:hypothetical protein